MMALMLEGTAKRGATARRVLGALWIAGLSWVVAGCTIVTSNGAAPPPRPRRGHGHARTPHPPPAPRTAPGPRPAPSSTRLAVNVTAVELPAQPPREDPPRTPTRPSTMPAGVAAGRPSGFTPAASPAFWIWQGPRGGWRIRTTTKSALHLFRGRITPLDGVIGRVSPSRTELGDQIWQSESSWHFAFKTAGHADGFTFQTSTNGCVKFDLQLDGGPVPKRIVVGKGQASPPTNHFILCPHGKQP